MKGILPNREIYDDEVKGIQLLQSAKELNIGAGAVFRIGNHEFNNNTDDDVIVAGGVDVLNSLLRADKLDHRVIEVAEAAPAPVDEAAEAPVAEVVPDAKAVEVAGEGAVSMDVE